MLFGKHINRYYLRHLLPLLLGIAALVAVDIMQLKVPELYALALETYRAEGDALQSRYDLLRSQEQQDYSRYRDRAADYAAEQKRLAEAYKDAYSRYTDQRDFDYKQQRDKVTDDQWQKKFNESVRQFAVKNGW